MHFIHEKEKFKDLFKKTRNDVYYDAVEIANINKNYERFSKIKNPKTDEKEAAMLITYKIVHYIHIFSGYKINRMIAEFMQDEYKNLWLYNCSYISYEKIEGLADIESIYLKRMSRIIPSFNFSEARTTRSRTVQLKKTPTEIINTSKTSNLVIFRGVSLEEEAIKNTKIKKNKNKIKFETNNNFGFQDSPKHTCQDPEKIKEIKRFSSILLNPQLVIDKEILTKQNISQTLEINKIRSRNYIPKAEKLCCSPKKTYILKRNQQTKRKFHSVMIPKTYSFYYHGNFVKNKQSFNELKENVFKKNIGNKLALPYLLYQNIPKGKEI